jgi:hypothetical protein
MPPDFPRIWQLRMAHVQRAECHRYVETATRPPVCGEGRAVGHGDGPHYRESKSVARVVVGSVAVKLPERFE